VPGSRIRKTTVIVLVIRGRPTKITATSKIAGILTIWSCPDKDKLGVSREAEGDEGLGVALT
jgi:hypothetical protein